jgi:hypothetical protein
MKVMSLIFFFSLIAAGQANAGGSFGGGTGLVLDLQSQDITPEQFSALVLSGSENTPLLINSLPAQVRAVDFQSRTIELELEGVEVTAVLRATEQSQ